MVRRFQTLGRSLETMETAACEQRCVVLHLADHAMATMDGRSFLFGTFQYHPDSPSG